MVRTMSVRLNALIAIIAMINMSTHAIAEKTPTPEEVLESRGLNRDGKFYIIQAEKQALREFIPVVARSQEMSNAWDIQAEMVRRVNLVSELDQRRIMLNGEINGTQNALANLPRNNLVETRQNRAQLEQYLQGLRTDLTQTNSNLALARQQAPSPGDLKAASNEFTKTKDAFLESCKTVEPTIGRAMGEYNKLKNDPEVQNAIGVLARRAKLPGTLKVGPSKNFQTAVQDMIKFKKMVSPEANVRLKSVKPKRTGKK